MIIIDRQRVIDEFKRYTDAYDISDDKVRLKVGHTYRVADNAEKIARSIELSEADVDLAWLIGMLHDIGRFEQLRRYNTFIDADSVDHAQFGADLLFEENLLTRFVDVEQDLSKMEQDEAILEQAIRYHSMYRVPEGVSQRAQVFCDIIRDADKIDIYRVNVEFPLESVYNTTTEELRSGVVSEEAFSDFKEHHAVLRKNRFSTVDHVLGHISLFFELVYPCSARLVLEAGYMDKLLHFESDNPQTMARFKEIRQEIAEYMQKVQQ